MRAALFLTVLLASAGCGRTGFEGVLPTGGTPGGIPFPEGFPGPSPSPTGAMTWVLSFDGTDDRVLVADSPAFDLDEITVEAWIHPTGLAGEEHIVSHHDDDSDDGWVLLAANQRIEFRVYNGGSPRAVGQGTAAATLSTGQWHHVAGTFNGSTAMSVYVDGVEVDSTGFAPTSTSPYNGPLVIGGAAGEGGVKFAGMIDEIHVSNVERYTGSTYPRPTAAFVPDGNTITLWHVDDGTGQAAPDSGVAAAHGTLGSSAGADADDPSWAQAPAIANR